MRKIIFLIGILSAFALAGCVPPPDNYYGEGYYYDHDNYIYRSGRGYHQHYAPPPPPGYQYDHRAYRHHARPHHHHKNMRRPDHRKHPQARHDHRKNGHPQKGHDRKPQHPRKKNG